MATVSTLETGTVGNVGFLTRVDALRYSIFNAKPKDLVDIVASSTPDDLQGVDETFWTIWAGTIIDDVLWTNQQRRDAMASAFQSGLKDPEQQAYAAAYLWLYGGEESGRGTTLQRIIPALQENVSADDQIEFIHKTTEIIGRLDGSEKAEQLSEWYTSLKGSQ
jgi:hypothetical protein